MRDMGPYAAYRITTDKPGHVDLAMPIGTPVYALRAGAVEHALYDDSYGFSVLIQEADGSRTRYAHFATPPVVFVGASVVAQSLLGYSGNTGISTGPHLHLGARDEANNPIDPLRGAGVNWANWVAVAAVGALAAWLLV